VPDHVLPEHNFFVHPVLSMHNKGEFVDLDFWCKSSTCINRVLIAKGLPKRCQIRELGKSMLRYTRVSARHKTTLWCMMMCSLCGMYFTSSVYDAEHALDNVISFDVLFYWMNLIYYSEKCAVTQLTQGVFAQNQRQLLFVLRDCLLYNIRTVPVLNTYVMQLPIWKSFEAHTLDNTSEVTKLWISRHNPDSLTGLFWKSIEPKMAHIHSLHKMCMLLSKMPPVVLQLHHHIYNIPIDSNYCATITTAIFAIKSKINVHFKQTADIYSHCARAVRTYYATVDLEPHTCATSLLHRLKRNFERPASYTITCSILLQCQNMAVDNQAVQYLLLQLLHTSAHDFALLDTEIAILETNVSTKLYPLDRLTARSQCTTLGIPTEAELIDNLRHTSVSTEFIHAGFVLVCIHCKTIKSACCLPDAPCKSQLYRPCRPSMETCIDDQNCRLLCTKCTSQIKDTTYNSLALMRCQNDSLLILDLIGRVLEFNSKLYTLCVQCGTCMQCSATDCRVCSWCKIEAHKDTPSTKCDLCHTLSKNTSLSYTAVSWSPSLRLKRVQFCTQCTDAYATRTSKHDIVCMHNLTKKREATQHKKAMSALKKRNRYY
jgi:hypothetical protein